MRLVRRPWLSQPHQPAGIDAARFGGATRDAFVFSSGLSARGLPISWLADPPQVLSDFGAAGSLLTRSLNGSSQYGEMPAEAAAFGAGAFSVSFWLKANGTSVGTPVVFGNNQSGTASGFLIDAVSGINAALRINTAASFATSLSTSVVGLSAQPTFATICRSAAGKYTWYINGREDSTATTSAYNVNSGFAPMIGRQRNGAAYLWGQVGLLVTHNADIGLEGHRQLFQEPWCWAEPQRLWVPALSLAPPEIVGTLAGSEAAGADAAVLLGQVVVRGPLATAEAGADAAAATGAVRVEGTLAGLEAGADTAAVAGVVAVRGTLAATEAAADAAAVAGQVRVAGALAAEETGADSAALGGVVRVAGALAATEAGADAAALSGSQAIAGVLAATETGADAAAGAGVVRVAGSAAATEAGPDAAAVAGRVLVRGTAAAQEAGSDAAALPGRVRVAGTLAAAEPPVVDVAALIGPLPEYVPARLRFVAPGRAVALASPAREAAFTSPARRILLASPARATRFTSPARAG